MIRFGPEAGMLKQLLVIVGNVGSDERLREPGQAGTGV